MEERLAFLCPDDDLATWLRTLIVAALVCSPVPTHAIVDGTVEGQPAEEVRRLLRGELAAGLHWPIVEAVMTACGADPALLELAAELCGMLQAPKPSGDPVASVPTEDAKALAEPSAAGRRPAPRLDPSEAETAAELIALAVKYRRLKGSPSYSEMAKKAGRYGSTSLSELPRETKLRKPERLLAFLAGCSATEEELQQWREAWERIAITEGES